MTETDKVYIAVMETMKKYGPEQAIGGLEKYVIEGNARCITGDNEARKTLCELTPAQVLQDAMRTNLKYEQIIRERGYAQVLPNYNSVEQAIAEHQNGEKISIKLSSGDLTELMCRLTKTDVAQAFGILANNPELFHDFLSSYCIAVGNFRPDLNRIPNENYPMINNFFAQFEQQEEKQRV